MELNRICVKTAHIPLDPRQTLLHGHLAQLVEEMKTFAIDNPAERHVAYVVVEDMCDTGGTPM